MGIDIVNSPNPLDFDIPKWWGSADEQGSSRVLEDSDLGAWNMTDRDLFDYEVDDVAEKIKEAYRLPKKPWEVVEGAEGENKGVDVEMADTVDATESAT